MLGCMLSMLWLQPSEGHAQSSPDGAVGSCASIPSCPSLMQRGDALYRMQLYEDARLAFEAAYGLAHDPLLLLAIARTLRQSRGSLSSIRYYELYLDSRDTDPQRREQAQAELREVRSESGLSARSTHSKDEVARRRLTQKLVGGSLLAAGSSLLLLGVLATVNNQSELRLNTSPSCAYGDSTAAKCYVLPGVEASAWLFGLGFVAGGILVLLDPAHAFVRRTPTLPAPIRSEDEIRRPNFEPSR